MAPLLLSGLLLCPLTCVGQTAAAPAAQLNNQGVDGLKGISAPFTFAVIGDIKNGGRVYNKLAETIAGEKPAFVVNTGDVIASPGDQGEWDEFVGLSKPITMPYFIASGNHDIDDARTEGEFREFVRQPGNGLYFSFVAGNSLFIILDTERPGAVSRIAGEQMGWLEKTLEASRERFKFVFMHRPMYPDKDIGMHYNDSVNIYPEERDKLQAMFEKYGVGVVFTGHEHLYMRKKVGGVYHVICGGGGANLYAPEDKGGFHFYIKGIVDNSSASFEVIDDKGRVRDQFKL